MGGMIGAESIVGVGSVFWIELISTEAPEILAGRAEATAVARPQMPPGARIYTVLYVEDSPANLALVERLIARRPDMRLLTAVNGTLGIKLARASQPDLILMDIHLPGISGIDALKILREDPNTKHIPVVALSANAMPANVKKGLEAGFFRYLTKPVKVSEFMETLNAALKLTEEQLCQPK
jgi:CheY-like chemotaxis protein